MLNEIREDVSVRVRETSIPIIRARASVVYVYHSVIAFAISHACLSRFVPSSTIHLEISYARQSRILILRIISRFKRYTFDHILDPPLGIRGEYLLNRITFSLSLSWKTDHQPFRIAD